jgi:hypothetical protein
MSEKLPPHFLELVSDVLLKSYWRKRALHDFLRRSGIKDSFLATWREDETKRDFLYRVFPALEASPRGPDLLRQMALNLSEQTAFPDLEGWEDSKLKQDQATAAVKALKACISKERQAVADAKAEAGARKRAAEARELARRRQADLAALSERLNSLATTLGTQSAGYSFQDWFYDLAGYFEVLHRRPYSVDGRQIDGTITVDGTTYLVELKFTQDPAGGPDVDSIHKKVHDKADNTMGILVSISGFTAPALEGASGARNLLLLLDHGHLYRMLSGSLSLPDLIMRIRRHASQTGRGHLAAADL